MSPVLVDANVLIDVATDDPTHEAASSRALAALGAEAPLLINPLIYAEVSVAFTRIENLDGVLPETVFKREPLPWTAAFLAGKAFRAYRRRGGARTSPLPDFYIGAHAAVQDYRLLSRDRGRFESYFPTVELLVP